jgi:hypothetical protein
MARRLKCGTASDWRTPLGLAWEAWDWKPVAESPAVVTAQSRRGLSDSTIGPRGLGDEDRLYEQGAPSAMPVDMRAVPGLQFVV